MAKAEEYSKSYRLLCDGVVIDHVPGHLPRDFSIRLLTCFQENIVKALTDKTFMFDGKHPGSEWLEMQENRLGVRLSSGLTIIDPGEVFPVCSYLQNLVSRNR